MSWQTYYRDGACDEETDIASISRIVGTRTGLDSALTWFNKDDRSPLNPWYYGHWTLLDFADRQAGFQALFFRLGTCSGADAFREESG